MNTAILCPDGLLRCRWCTATPEYLDYHDREWGQPVADDRRLFEKISLEGFQSGLSWRTILTKRENFRAAFAGFDFHQVARFGPQDVARLLDPERGAERPHERHRHAHQFDAFDPHRAPPVWAPTIT